MHELNILGEKILKIRKKIRESEQAGDYDKVDQLIPELEKLRKRRDEIKPISEFEMIDHETVKQRKKQFETKKANL